MKIIINAASIYKGGAEQVVNSFINECREIRGNEYHVFLCDNIMDQLDRESFSDNFFFYKLEKRPGISFYNLFNTLQYFDRLEKKIKPDFVLSTGGHGYWKPKVPIVTAFNIPHYVYPESPYFDKISIKKKVYWKLKKIFDLSFYRSSDAIIVQTDDVNQRVKKLLPDIPVYTVSNTVNGVFLEAPKFENKLPEQAKDEIRLLTVSSNYPHKNLDIIKDVLDELYAQSVFHVNFVLTLPEDAFKNKFGHAKYQDNIINVGSVPIEECPSLYKECDIMFLPTLLECFSASYVEAMAMEKPIITSDLGFAHTICRNAAVYFDPVNAKDIANKIVEVVNDSALQEKLTDAGAEIYQTINTPKERARSFLKIGQNMIEA